MRARQIRFSTHLHPWSQFKGSLVVALMWSTIAALGQSETQHVTDATVKSWSHWMVGQNANLSQSQVAFQEQSASRMESRSCGEKAFGRWSWWAQERSGLAVLPKPEAWWEASEAWRQAIATSTMPATETLEWTYVAPQSVPTHGGAGRINKIQIDPHDSLHWYACAPAGGLWHSFDEGLSWQIYGVDVLAPLGVTDVWIDPEDANHLWLATGDGNGGDTYSIGILETTDGGSSWEPLELSFEISQGRKIYAMRHHPVAQETAFVGTDLGLFKTTNGGQTFDLVLPGRARDAIWVNDSTAIAGIENQGIFRTENSGATWEPCNLPESNNSVGRIQLASQAINSGTQCDTLYAVAGHYFQQNLLAFWRSTDAGLTWTAQLTPGNGPNILGYTINGEDAAGQAFWDLCIAVDPDNAERVLVGGVNVWETLNGGTTWNCPAHWQGASESKYTHADQHSITIFQDNRVVLGNDGGVFLWDGDQVMDLSHGLRVAQGYALGVHPQKAGALLIGTQDNGTTLVQPDNEARILDGDGFHAFFDPGQEGRLYASAYYGLLYRSDDGGRTMTNIANYLQTSGPNEVGAWQTPFQLHPAVPGRIVAAKKSVHFSDDGGDHWTSWGGIGNTRATAMALSNQDAQAALIAKNSELFWRDSSTMNFHDVPGMPGSYIGDVALDAEDSGTWWMAFGDYVEGRQVWRTNDYGSTWQNVSSGLPTLPIHVLKQLADGNWVCGSDLGVHIWDEENMSWSNYGQGLPLTPAVDLTEDLMLNRLLVSTYGRGLWSCPLPTTPSMAGAMTNVIAPKTQCMGVLTGQPHFQFSGSESLEEVHCIIEAHQEDLLVQDTVWTSFETPLTHGDVAVLNAFHLDVPNPGGWDVTLKAWNPNDGELGPLFSTTLFASGLGHTSTLTWWGDCENVDMRWELRASNNQDVLLQSLPLAPSDTISQTWCLSEGCYELVWNDEGGDGFSGSFCGESGGYSLSGPFQETLFYESGLDFGEELVVPFCVSVPWCFADFNGDGIRSVDDLLTMLSEFGCSIDCATDTDFDESVGVGDLMNILSVFGQGCSTE